MKYILFFLLILLCIIQLNAHHDHRHRPHKRTHIMKPSKSKTNSTTKTKQTTKPTTKPGKKKDTEKPNDPRNKSSEPKNNHKDKVLEIIGFAKSKEGCGYALGTQGDKLTKTKYKELKKIYKGEFKDETRQWLNKECYDCSGLVMVAYGKVGVKLPRNANDQWLYADWKKKGDIKDLPKDKVCILYQKGKDKMIHTGIYIGNGIVIEAGGAKRGVLETSLEDGHWTNYAIPNGAD